MLQGITSRFFCGGPGGHDLSCAVYDNQRIGPFVLGCAIWLESLLCGVRNRIHDGIRVDTDSPVAAASLFPVMSGVTLPDAPGFPRNFRVVGKWRRYRGSLLLTLRLAL